jgi:hypothetical protein
LADKIFISYRREQSAANALSIGQYLEHQFGRKNVFIDVDMRAGAKFPQVLEERLKACKVMLALLGPGWAEARDDEGHRRLDRQDDWVRLEIARALDRGITVIPVRINGADLPKKSSLPEDIQGLLDHQATTITNTGFRNEMAGLVRDIRRIPDPARLRRQVLIGSLFAVLLGALGFGLYGSQLLSWAQVALGDIRTAIGWQSTPRGMLMGEQGWTYYGKSTETGYAFAAQIGSAKKLGDRAMINSRQVVDPSYTTMAGGKTLQNADVGEGLVVFECHTRRSVYATETIYDGNGLYYLTTNGAILSTLVLK